MPETIEERVRKVIADTLGVEPEKITPESSLVYDLGADSLDTIEVIMALQEEFDIEIPDEDILATDAVGKAIAGSGGGKEQKLTIVSNIVGYIEGKTK